MVIVLSVAVLLCVVGYAIDGRRLALSLLFWGVFLRIVFTWQVSFLVNSFAHGAEPGPLGDRSRDVWWLGVLAFGDGWHYTHHRHPQSARQGYPWYRLDLAWVTIRTLEILGIATDVKRLRKL
jgi:stearoyl-CoA desaturase (delta-9 desaturase)